MMPDQTDRLVTHEELAQATGYTRSADIRRCLERQGIRVRVGRGGRVWTTLGAIQGLPPAGAAQPTPVEFA
jgi:hypothetical protein